MTLDLQDPPATVVAGPRAAMATAGGERSAVATVKPPLLLRATAVGKQYHLWDRPSARLWFSLLSRTHRTLRALLPAEAPALAAVARKRDRISQQFTALENVSFELRRGESLGIIGRNGSGKSTLLQIIAGTLCPSAGKVEVYGRVAALLELGSGFNMEFTGRENVYLNASILGFSKHETDAHFDEIAAFADIGEFIEQPVKTYSSGMLVRLAFAVQAAVEPDLFIVDEALAVGDIYFQSKCNKLLRQKLDAGMTLLLVSHDASAVRALCRRALVLDRGRAIFLGPSDEAVNVYQAIHTGAKRTEDAPSRSDLAAVAEALPTVPGIGDEIDEVPGELAQTGAARAIPQGFAQYQDEIGDGVVTLTGCALFDFHGRPTSEFTAGEPIRMGVTFRPNRDFEAGEALAGFALRDRFNNVIAASTTFNHDGELPALRAGHLYALFLRLPGRIGSGRYLLDFGFGSEPDTAGSPARHHHRIGGIAAFGVGWHGTKVRFQGLCDLGAEFGFVQLAEPVTEQSAAEEAAPLSR